ncbi:MAG TPA: DNA polymerase I, partial [Balneolales bacterium]|nr:DNA polymerase I [Balneolales bacterium]
KENKDSQLDTFDNEKVDYRKIDSLDTLKRVVKEYISIGTVCFDTETTSTDPLQAELLGISLAVEEGKACYIPVGGVDRSGLDTQNVLKELKPLLGDESIDKIAQNMKYDYLVLANAGMEVKGQVFDTMLAAYLIDSNQALNMDALSRKYLNYDPISITELIGKKGKAQKNMADIPVDKVVPYACEDADVTLQLAKVLKKILERDKLEEVADTIEFPLATVLAKMERHGIRIDAGMLARFSGELGDEMVTLQDKIFEKAGEEFNLNSPQQLSHILFEKRGLPAGRKTKTGKYSTSEDVLSRLANEYELPGLLLDFRALSKLKSTYVDALPQLINPDTGRIHTSFNQNVAATGRLSSSNPNLQNIPIRTDRGREIRKAFIAEDGYNVLSADYSQIELRIIASMAEDKAMKEAFERGEDIHSRTAMEIFNLTSMDEVTPDLRRKAKEVNFGIPYGVSSFGLAQRLGIERKEGKAIIDAYFDRFPGIQKYINEIIAKAREQGYVTTLAGRRRYIPDIRSSNQNIRGFAERTAINMPIQGTAADLIKLAMIKLDERFEKEGIKSRMLIQVHDELVFELHESELETVPEIIRELMESAMDLDVPLKVEMGIADNWLDAH